LGSEVEEEDEGDAGVGRASDTLGVTVEEEERGGAEEEEGRVVGDLYSDVVLEEGASTGRNSPKSAKSPFYTAYLATG